jgi:WD40 repeat protein
METGKVIASLHGHDEEILSIKALRFNGENHYISTSQDGHIIKWRMADDWTTLVEMKKMEEEETCMAFNVSFVPNTGNKYFIAACDEVIRLYDFEHGKVCRHQERDQGIDGLTHTYTSLSLPLSLYFIALPIIRLLVFLIL